MTSKEALSRLKVNQAHSTGQNNHQWLINIGEQENMCTFKENLRWQNKTDIAPTFQTPQTMVDFFHNKGIDKLKMDENCQFMQRFDFTGQLQQNCLL